MSLALSSPPHPTRPPAFSPFTPSISAFFLALSALSLALSPAPALAQPGRIALLAAGFQEPVTVVFAPGDSSRAFVVERFGLIKIVDLATGAVRPRPFLDMRSVIGTHPNTSLGGMAFDPDYQSNGRFYVHYQATTSGSVTSRYIVTADPEFADAASRLTIIRVPRVAFGHFGGAIAFGSDGMLYIPEGDSGNGLVADPENAAQNPNDLRGKILRIDPRVDDFPADPERHYRIPADNPFVAGPGADEIWALGVRNPWQSSFDRVTGEYWFGDVGQDAEEEINVAPPAGTPGAAGRNYGWKCREGNVCTTFGGCGCTDPNLLPPLFSYGRSGGCSVDGGVVYRGTAFPDLAGWYVFSDFCSNFLWSLRRTASGTEFIDRSPRFRPPTALAFAFLTSITQDHAGELYLTDYGAGRILRIVPNPCIADVDDGGGTGGADGGVGIEDLLYYLGVYELGAIAADVDDGSGTGVQDGGVGIEDLLYFLTRYEAGC